MKITLKINGMKCAHCTARVEKALSSINEVSAKADLDNGCAYVECPDGYDVSVLRTAVEELGFDVTAAE